MTTITRRMLPLASLFLGACTSATMSEPPAAAPRPVRVEAISTPPAMDAVRYSATIEAFQQVPVAFKAAGYVDHVSQRAGADGRVRPLQAGDVVARGAELARVRDAEYRDRLAQSQARLAEGTAGLTKARIDLDRARRLFDADSLIKPELDAAQAAFDAAQARVEAVRADVDLATTSLRDVAVVAPLSGVVLDRKVDVGSVAGIGTVAFTLVDVSAVKARFGVPDAMLGAVRLGQPLDVLVEALNGSTFAGRISALAPAADPQGRVFDVEVTLANPGGRLRPGMIGTVAFDLSRAATTPTLPVVPVGAVIKPEGTSQGFAVFVVESSGTTEVARRRVVDLGDVVGNGVLVQSGLTPGERVVVTGASLLTDGDAIRVIP